MQTLLPKRTAKAAPDLPSPSLPWRPLRISLDGSLLVSCRLGGRTVVGMLDTGAAATIVDPRHAPPPPCGAGDRISLRSDWGVRDLRSAPPLRLGLADRTLAATRPIVADLSDLQAVTGEPVGLIVGQDILAQGVFAFDFAAQKFAFLAGVPAMSSRWRRVELFAGAEGRVCLDVRIDGGTRTSAVFDLGSNSPVMMALDFARRRGLMCDRPTSSTATATLAGPQIGRAFTLASVSLGGFTVASPPADAFARWSHAQVPVNLGFPIFRRFDLALDLAGGALWLAPSSNPVEAFQRERSGLGLAYLGDRLRVMHVASNSPAALGGWREGEEITAVDGGRVDQGYFTSGLAAWRNRRPGTAVELGGPWGSRRLVLADFY